MTQTQQTPKPDVSVSFRRSDLLIIGGLLVLILAMLAFLWARERSRRLQAERSVVALQNQAEQLKKSLLAQLLGAAAESPSLHGAAEPFRRDDHVQTAVVVDGRSRTAFRINAKGARRLGFLAGDVIIVEEAAERPSSGPGTGTVPSQANP